MKHRLKTVALPASVALVLGVTARAGQQPAAPVCPASPVATVAAQIPPDVCIPNGFTEIATNYFDDYSWRAFVALVWPASNRRGVPDAGKPISAAGPRVFETYKPLWEIFHADGTAPEPAFDRYDTAAANPCAASSRFGDVTIGSASGIDDIGQAGIGSLDPPLGSGPYQVERVVAGRTVAYKRDENYWARDLPVNVGQNNFDRIRIDYYADQASAFEAFKAARASTACGATPGRTLSTAKAATISSIRWMVSSTRSTAARTC